MTYFIASIPIKLNCLTYNPKFHLKEKNKKQKDNATNEKKLWKDTLGKCH